MNQDEKRFERTYKQGMSPSIQVWVDKETGVNYLFMQSGYSGGLTVLLDRDGKPVITPIVK
ncbi:MAG: xylan 1,4-beta-xylosidase [Clostridia bacterium]|nr:xylan 1,4-beta-xylosidase [Clostridia bacterium]